jgi:hypothetical protein
VLWQKPVEGGPVQRVLAQDGDAYVMSGGGALLHVDPATGAVQPVPGVLGPTALLGAVDGYIALVGGYAAAGSGPELAFSGPAR